MQTVADAGDITVLYRAEARSLLRVAYVLLGNPHEAEEVVQDAFAALGPRLSTIENPAAYLRTSVVPLLRLAPRH